MRYGSLFAAAALCLALSCAAPAAPPEGLPLNAEMKAFIGAATVLSADTTTTVMAGSEFCVVLEENASTGYKWTYTAAPADLATETGKESFGPPAQPMVGAPVLTVWKFKASAEGQLTLTYLYYRPWERPETAIKRMVYTVKVVR
jgi:predicted secreted protein